MATRIVGVMGPGATATPEECRPAERLGALIANEGWTTLTGIVDGEQRSPRAKHSENDYSHDGDCPTRSVTSQATEQAALKKLVANLGALIDQRLAADEGTPLDRREVVCWKALRT